MGKKRGVVDFANIYVGNALHLIRRAPLPFNEELK